MASVIVEELEAAGETALAEFAGSVEAHLDSGGANSQLWGMLLGLLVAKFVPAPKPATPIASASATSVTTEAAKT